jgi:hypothetical protein
MADGLRAQRDTALRHLDELIRRGRALREMPAGIPPWQKDCAVAINELSGGSKAHWLSRAFSGALLVRSAAGGAVVEASVTEIVDRILDVLHQAGASLSRMEDVEAVASAGAPATRRFDFVHNRKLRPILEQAYVDTGRALEEGDFTNSLVGSCGIIEAMLTDALEHRGLQIANGGLDARAAAAEKAGLIRGGCARLPPVARAYRDAAAEDGQAAPALTVSARDAKVARQVLHVVMRDLDPGR